MRTTMPDGKIELGGVRKLGHEDAVAPQAQAQEELDASACVEAVMDAEKT